MGCWGPVVARIPGIDGQVNPPSWNEQLPILLLHHDATVCAPSPGLTHALPSRPNRILANKRTKQHRVTYAFHSHRILGFWPLGERMRASACLCKSKSTRQAKQSRLSRVSEPFPKVGEGITQFRPPPAAPFKRPLVSNYPDRIRCRAFCRIGRISGLAGARHLLSIAPGRCASARGASLIPG